MNMWRCLLLAVFLSGSMSGSVVADVGDSPGLKPDVRLLIDISGSMKQSDPENLRAPALDLIVRLLPEGSRAGVWIFGEDVELLVEHRVIDDAWRIAAQRAVANIDNSGLRTNIPGALKAVTYDLGGMDGSYRTSIVLLTDGKVDVSDSPMVNASAAKSLLDTLAPELGATGIPVHTIALSDEADWDFLRSLAEQTNGIAEKAESAGELTEIFLQSLEMVAPTARVPIGDNGFQIDDSVSEFTVLVFLEDGEATLALIDPSGQRYQAGMVNEDVEWFRNRKFALVTVSTPQSGTWQLLAPGGTTTRVTVISDLRLEVDPLPNSLPGGRQTELGLRLLEHGLTLTDPEVLELFTISVDITGPDGAVALIDVSGEYEVPADGEYRVNIPAFQQSGRYQLMARVQGETLQRELPMYVEVVASDVQSMINTRGEQVPEESLESIAINAGVVLLVVIVVLMWFLRRRRKRRLALWERRSRDNGNSEGSQLLSGLSARTEERGD